MGVVIVINLFTAIVTDNLMGAGHRQDEIKLNNLAEMLEQSGVKNDLITIADFEKEIGDSSSPLAQALVKRGISTDFAEDLFRVTPTDEWGSACVYDLVDAALRIKGSSEGKHLLSLTNDIHRVDERVLRLEELLQNLIKALDQSSSVGTRSEDIVFDKKAAPEENENETTIASVTCVGKEKATATVSI